MNPSTPQAARPAATAYRNCPKCKEPLTRPNEAHLFPEQCIKALKASLQAYGDVLLHQGVKYASALRDKERYGAALWQAAHAAGGRLAINNVTPDGSPTLSFESIEANGFVIVATIDLVVVPAQN